MNSQVEQAQQKRRVALIERLGFVADLACQKPLEGELGDVVYDLLREAAAQISSDRLHLASLASQPPVLNEREIIERCAKVAETWVGEKYDDCDIQRIQIAIAIRNLGGPDDVA